MTEATTPVYVDAGPSGPVAMGWLMILGGAVAVAAAFFIDVGVSSGADGLYGLPERVANADKMAIRHMVLACGLTSFVSGWIALGVGLILSEIKRD